MLYVKKKTNAANFLSLPNLLVVIWMLFFVGLLLPAGLLAACLFGILIQCVADL